MRRKNIILKTYLELGCTRIQLLLGYHNIYIKKDVFWSKDNCNLRL